MGGMPMNLLKNKKHTEIRKETAPLKMKRGQKKLFALYAVMVLSICIGATCVYAAGDPLTVVNNLSTFIFSLIRAIGLILLGFGIVQVGLSLKSHDPSQRAAGAHYTVDSIEELPAVIDNINNFKLSRI